GGLLENINRSPVGHLLRMISSLPEVRHEKVDTIRRQINSDEYHLGENLDLALDLVIEEFVVDG
ncbi:MAG: flagellar biosynthesis anti-sigma factor FlgM, partial [Planctomycetota bacterium]